MSLLVPTMSAMENSGALSPKQDLLSRVIRTQPFQQVITSRQSDNMLSIVYGSLKAFYNALAER